MRPTSLTPSVHPGILLSSPDAPGDGCHYSVPQFPGCQGGLGDAAVPPGAQHHGVAACGVGSLCCCCSQALVSRAPLPAKPWGTVPSTLPSEPWFPHVPPKVARADMDQAGLPMAETFIDKRGTGLGFQHPPLARTSERAQEGRPAGGLTEPRPGTTAGASLTRWERTAAPAGQSHSPSTWRADGGGRKREREHESGPQSSASPGPTQGVWGPGTDRPLGLTLAWYSLMKGWDRCASFSWDR